MSIEDDMIMSTVRLKTNLGVGTGFFYAMKTDEVGKIKPVIVTNKHVLKDAYNLLITLTLQVEGELRKQTFNIDHLPGNVIFHPNPQVDLAVLPFTGLFQIIEEKFGSSPNIFFLDDSILPNDQQIKNFSAIEDVLVIGYPNGLWDEVNCRPLVRRGITASDYRIDYEGKPQFIIDCAIVPGSSGSPVFLFNKGMYHDNNGGIIMGEDRLFLLGVNSSVFIQGIEGEIVERAVPTSYMSLSRIPISLGIIIKSNQLKDFLPLLPK